PRATPRPPGFFVSDSKPRTVARFIGRPPTELDAVLLLGPSSQDIRGHGIAGPASTARRATALSSQRRIKRAQPPPPRDRAAGRVATVGLRVDRQQRMIQPVRATGAPS